MSKRTVTLRDLKAILAAYSLDPVHELRYVTADYIEGYNEALLDVASWAKRVTKRSAGKRS